MASNRLRELAAPSPFVLECRRLMDARIAAKGDRAAIEDAEWALTYAMQMHRAGRFDEYLASRPSAHGSAQ